MRIGRAQLIVAVLTCVCVGGRTAARTTSAGCHLMETMQADARREIITYAQLMRRNILNTSTPIGNSQLLADVFFNAFTFTANFTWEIFEEDCTTFVTTGDIPQMWLRDSSVQMMTYTKHSPQLPAFTRVLESTILRQVRFFLSDPYGSAFYISSGPNAGPNRNECPPSDFCEDCSCTSCSPQCSPWTYQHDFELDSPLFMFLLQWSFWQSSPERAAAFLTENDEIKQAVFALVDLLKTEQQHSASSPYYYKPLPNAFADQTGMVWSFARPSDDQTELGYNVPQNLMAVSVLSKLGAMNDALWLDADLALGLSTLKQEIEVGIKTYGILIPASAPDDDDDDDDDSVVVFAFETDGWGNTTSPVLDDANMPNLLWLPYLGFDEEAFPPGIYENTRKLILSASNLNWFENPAAAEVSILTTGDVAAVVGLGSQHQSLGLRPQWPGQECTEQCVWHLGLVMQGMTAADHATEEGGDKGGGNDDDDGGGDSEKAKCLQLVLDTAFHGLMHEGFNVANTSNYNRDYFGWANALFSEWVLSDFVSSEARPPS